MMWLFWEMKTQLRNLSLILQELGLMRGFFNDLLGTSIADNLFENMGSGLETALEEEISTLLGNYEPRIELNSVYVIADQDSNELSIQVDYNIVGLPIPSQTIEFLLQPTRV